METMKKTNTEFFKEAQNTVDEINLKKEEVEVLLKIIDDLEIKYLKIREQIKSNNLKK